MLRTSRTPRHRSFMTAALALAEQSTCARRAVGCILIDKHHRIIGSGYNGVHAGARHCIDEPCGGHLAASGQSLDSCRAVHAEQNALMQCSDTKAIVTAFCTTFPCLHCIKLLLNTPCSVIYYMEDYSDESLNLWLSEYRHAAKFTINTDGTLGPVEMAGNATRLAT